MNINYFTDDILKIIFGFVEYKHHSNIRRVCKKWLKLSEILIDPGINHNYAIRFACKKGYLELVRKLLQDPRVNPGAFNDDALYQASKNEHQKIVELLITDPRVDSTKLKIFQKNYKHKSLVKGRQININTSSSNICIDLFVILLIIIYLTHMCKF